MRQKVSLVNGLLRYAIDRINHVKCCHEPFRCMQRTLAFLKLWITFMFFLKYSINQSHRDELPYFANFPLSDVFSTGTNTSIAPTGQLHIVSTACKRCVTYCRNVKREIQSHTCSQICFLLIEYAWTEYGLNIIWIPSRLVLMLFYFSHTIFHFNIPVLCHVFTVNVCIPTQSVTI